MSQSSLQGEWEAQHWDDINDTYFRPVYVKDREENNINIEDYEKKNDTFGDVSMIDELLVENLPGFVEFLKSHSIRADLNTMQLLSVKNKDLSWSDSNNSTRILTDSNDRLMKEVNYIVKNAIIPPPNFESCDTRLKIQKGVRTNNGKWKENYNWYMSPLMKLISKCGGFDEYLWDGLLEIDQALKNFGNAKLINGFVTFRL